MTAREQFLADLATWALYVAVAWAIARTARDAVRAVAAAYFDDRRQRRRLALVLADPMRYCLVGHVHAERGEAMLCEAAHGVGDQ